MTRMQDKIEKQHQVIERGRRSQLAEYADEHGFVFEIEDPTLGSWFVRPDSPSAERIRDSQELRVVTW